MITLSKAGNYSNNTKDIMNFIAYCDQRSIFDISIDTGINLENIIKIYETLTKLRIINKNFEKKNL